MTYTRLQENDIHGIAEKFNLKVSAYQPITQGIGNSNFRLDTDQGRQILTVFEIDPNRVKNMSKVLLLLEEHDFPAPRVRYTRDGEILAKYRGKLVMVKRYIAGQVLEGLDQRQVRQAGSALARLHRIPAPDYLPEHHAYVKENYAPVMEQEINLAYRRWVEKSCRNILENLPPNLPVGFVHGDLFYDNLLFEDGKFKAILDFEDVSRIPKVFDLGMAVVGICSDDTEIDIDKVSALVDGYQKIRSLEESEVESLQYFVEWAAVLTSVWRFWRYKIDMPDIKASRDYHQMVNLAKNAHGIPKDAFTMAVFS